MRKLIVLIVALCSLGACKKYLDVVPDSIATIDNTFKARVNAEQYLFTCYTYLPEDANYGENPAILGGDEIWHYDDNQKGWALAKGKQSLSSPLLDYWSGDAGVNKQSRGIPSVYKAIRDCNIFLENIQKVRDMTQMDKDRWRPK